MIKNTLDWETNGVIKYKEVFYHRNQPRGVQLSMLLHDQDNKLKTELNVLLKPDGWTIPKEASDIHNITTEECEKFGIPFKDVWNTIKPLISVANVVVAHNLSFDSQILRIELYYMFLKDGDSHEEAAKKAEANYQYILKKAYCTMEKSTDVLKIPGKWGKNKWPLLMESYKAAKGEEFDGAHDASQDTKAAFEVYKWLIGLGVT